LRLLQNNTEYDYQNIIKFYELTKEPSNEYYIMILEYPDEGKLCDYFSELQWTKKYPWL
ncbi:18201_t:CDS:2, partial [Gigaspora rosea]